MGGWEGALDRPAAVYIRLIATSVAAATCSYPSNAAPIAFSVDATTAAVATASTALAAALPTTTFLTPATDAAAFTAIVASG